MMPPTLPAEWQIQDAKNRFSQVVKAAADGVPQSVTVHGKPTAVVISAEAYAKLKRAPKTRLLDDLLAPGLTDEGDEALFARAQEVSPHREVEL